MPTPAVLRFEENQFCADLPLQDGDGDLEVDGRMQQQASSSSTTLFSITITMPRTRIYMVAYCTTAVISRSKIECCTRLLDGRIQQQATSSSTVPFSTTDTMPRIRMVAYIYRHTPCVQQLPYLVVLTEVQKEAIKACYGALLFIFYEAPFTCVAMIYTSHKP